MKNAYDSIIPGSGSKSEMIEAFDKLERELVRERERETTNPDQWGKVPSKPVLNALKYMRLQPEELFQKLRQMGYTVIISNSGIS